MNAERDDIFRPRESVAAYIYDKLVAEQAKRRDNPYWQRDEMNVLFLAIDTERRKLGKGPILFSDVEAAERSARGHVDYTTKCAFYGAELVRR